MLPCAGVDRLQTGIVKSCLFAARIEMAIVPKKALHHVKFKFPGHQKITVSGKW